MSKLRADTQRYLAAAHALQTGVATEQELGSNDGTPKHLRVGINTGKVEAGALVKILIGKGLFTEEEYMESVANEMEREVAEYERRLTELLGKPVHLT